MFRENFIIFVFFGPKNLYPYTYKFFLVYGFFSKIRKKSPYMYRLFSKISTYTNYSQKLVHKRIILKNPYGLIWKCSLGSPCMWLSSVTLERNVPLMRQQSTDIAWNGWCYRLMWHCYALTLHSYPFTFVRDGVTLQCYVTCLYQPLGNHFK